MAKAKKVSVNSLQKLIKENEGVITCGSGTNEVEIAYKRTLSLDESLKFVNNVISTVFGISEDKPEVQFFAPEYKEYMIRYCVLTMHGNCNMPKNVSSQYEILFGTNIYSKLLSVINTEQLALIKESIERKIDYILAIENSVKNSLDGALNEIKSLITGNQEILEKYSLSDVIQIMDTISNNEELTADSIVNAVLERHAESK